MYAKTRRHKPGDGHQVCVHRDAWVAALSSSDGRQAVRSSATRRDFWYISCGRGEGKGSTRNQWRYKGAANESPFDSRDQICLHVGFHYIAKRPLCRAGSDKFPFIVDCQKDKPGSGARFAELLSGLATTQYWHCYVCYDHIRSETHPCIKQFLSVGDGPHDFEAWAQKGPHSLKYDRVVVGKEHTSMIQRRAYWLRVKPRPLRTVPLPKISTVL
jgi:hypothetical protein